MAAGLAFALLQNRNPDGGGRVGTGAASAPISAPAGEVPLDMAGTWEGRTGALDTPQGNGAAHWESLTLGTSGPFRQYQH